MVQRIARSLFSWPHELIHYLVARAMGIPVSCLTRYYVRTVHSTRSKRMILVVLAPKIVGVLSMIVAMSFVPGNHWLWLFAYPVIYYVWLQWDTLCNGDLEQFVHYISYGRWVNHDEL